MLARPHDEVVRLCDHDQFIAFGHRSPTPTHAQSLSQVKSPQKPDKKKISRAACGGFGVGTGCGNF